MWISVGPENSGLRLGYRKAADAGVWLGALILAGERSETTLGPADDDNAPPGALTIGEAARTAVAWADTERARGSLGGREALGGPVDRVAGLRC